MIDLTGRKRRADGVRSRPIRRHLVTMMAVSLMVTACGSDQSERPAHPVPTQSRHDSPATSAPPMTSARKGAPEVGTVLAHLTARGRANVISNGDGFTFVDSAISSLGPDAEELSVITTYDAAGTELARIGTGRFTGECGAADLVIGGRRTVLTELITKKPAQGIIPATYALDMDAWDARDGAHLWQIRLNPEQEEAISCGSYDGVLGSFAATRNGKWGLYRVDFDTYTVIDLATGETRNVPQATNVVGNYFAHVDPITDNGRTDIIEPTSGAVVGSAAPGGKLGGVIFDNGLNLATAPLFPVTSAGSSPYVGLSTDAMKIVAYPTPYSPDTNVVVYALPGMKTLWSTPATNSSDTRIVGANAGLVFIYERQGQPDEGNLTAYVDGTGERRWWIPYGEVCGISTTQLMLHINDQLATIDLATGKQISYKDAPNQENGLTGCPTILTSGISLWQKSDGMDVVQEIEP